MIGFVTILFLLLPMLSIPFVIIGYILDKKHTILYSIMLGLIMGIIAYYFIPPSTYDLHRHHLDLLMIPKMNLSMLWGQLTSTSEPLTYLIKYVIALLDNVNLLQFSIVSIGYSIFFYLMDDYRKMKEIKMADFIIVVLFLTTSFMAVNFISGLWNTFAMIIFSLIFYMEYTEKINKKICFIFYFLTILIHSSMIFPVAVLILFKILNEKLTVKIIVTLILALIIPDVILSIINSLTDISLFAELQGMYNAYFLNIDQFDYLFNIKVIGLEILKGILTLYAYLKLPKKEKNHNFMFVFLIAIFLISCKSIIFIRFVFCLQLVGIPVIFDYFKTRKPRIKGFVYILLIICSFVFMFYQVITFSSLEFGRLFTDSLFKNIFTIWER